MNLTSRIIDKCSRTLKHWSYLSIIEKSQALKAQVEATRHSKQDYAYTDNPRVTMIVQFFNKRHNIQKLIEHLRLSAAEEIIIIDDGSVDGSYKDWMNYLDRPNDFLLRCNDLFEVRTYDRALRMARGEFVCLLQDDDLPPPNNLWVEQALTLFDAFPELVILGGRDGMDIMLPEPIDTSEPQEYRRIGDIVECPGMHKLRIYGPPHYREPISGIPFMFTMTVNRAPTFLRRSSFLEMGGINQKYAPFQFDDDDACVRAWLEGYKVGFYVSSFARNFDVGGMNLFNKERLTEQIKINLKKFYSDYSLHLANGYLQNLVDSANSCLIHQKK
jgi:glycosyltransferase involved in cell wall biosynthesis